jgi:hypothetical protein
MAAVPRWIDARRVAGIRSGTLFCILTGGKNKRPVRPHLHGCLGAAAGIEKMLHPARPAPTRTPPS